MKERVAFWDNFKGLLIAFVVLGHFLWEYWGQGIAGDLVSAIFFSYAGLYLYCGLS